jgi:hypothetical protein
MHHRALMGMVMQVIHNVSGDRTAAMAEVYVDPPLLEAFGLNGGLGDSKMCPTYACKIHTRTGTPHTHATAARIAFTAHAVDTEAAAS